MLASLGTIIWRSAWQRRFVLVWVIFSIALVAFLLLSVERLRHGVQDHFARALTGTDLIVGPRTGSLQLLLYSVFHLGHADNTVSWQSVEALQQNPAVAWTIPLSLGDRHRGFPVVATNEAYFAHYRYGQQQALQLGQGRMFQSPSEAVIGAEIAERLAYQLGQSLTLQHGEGVFKQDQHDEHPFQVVGVLARTGTPVDRSVFIPLMGMEALHHNPLRSLKTPTHLPHSHADHDHEHATAAQTPQSVNAVLVGLHHRQQALSQQRAVNQYPDEALMAILPAVTLDELWGLLTGVERILWLISGLVALVSLASLMAVILSSLSQRRREMAILRSLGASPLGILGLLAAEGLLLSVLGLIAGVGLWATLQWGAAPWFARHYGLDLSLSLPTISELKLLGLILVTSAMSSLLPAWFAYRLTLADGLSPKG